MTEKFEIYKCEICGNVVQVLKQGAGELVCCGEAMHHLKPQHDIESGLGEKHNPKIEERDGETFVHVKSHPMINEHYIEFVEAYTKNKSSMIIKFFKPEDIAEMRVPYSAEEIDALEMCNIHGLWGN